MKAVKEMTVGEFGAYVASHLKACGIEVVLTGGSCVTIYSNNRYASYDLDFISDRGADGKKIKAALLSQESVGLRKSKRKFGWARTDFIDFAG